MKAQDEIVHRARVDLVRRYLVDPRPWPDGIDWGSHWYTTNKEHWDALATGVSQGVSESSVSKVTNETIDTPAPERITEIEIERLLKAGKSVRAIAVELDLTASKVQRIKAKLV